MNSCPLCTSNINSKIYHINNECKIDIVTCKTCQHIYTEIRSEINTESLYNDEVYKIVENRNSIFDRILSFEYNRVLKTLNKFKPKKGSLLDFGCGKGKFGSLAAGNDWNVKCVETSKERAQYASNIYGLDVNTEFFTSGKIFKKNFDVLTLFHVLEHLPDPKSLLQQLIIDNTDNEAIIVIEVPNFNSFQSRIAKEKWMHLDVPRHLSHFTPERLQNLMEEINLVVLKRSYFSYHLGLLGMVDSILKSLGYKRNIIFELKNRRTTLLLLCVALLFPFAFFMESIAAFVNKGGVIRYYLKRND